MVPFSSTSADQQVLGGDVGVAQRLGLLLGAVEDPVQLPAQGRLALAARLGGKSGDLPLGLLAQAGDVEPGLLEQRLNDTFVLAQQGAATGGHR